MSKKNCSIFTVRRIIRAFRYRIRAFRRVSGFWIKKLCKLHLKLYPMNQPLILHYSNQCFDFVR